ncbi:unnamed protein product [Toxocara canis]|uniref:RNase H domain-containing protein n=1 Tax=Toxocara canis TaxID=6265 RepID=A0A183TVV6_TOXCA|nr:unnamed protein product [Toxocara canis]
MDEFIYVDQTCAIGRCHKVGQCGGGVGILAAEWLEIILISLIESIKREFYGITCMEEAAGLVTEMEGHPSASLWRTY